MSFKLFKNSTLYYSPFAVSEFAKRLKSPGLRDLLDCNNQKEFNNHANVLANRIFSGNDTKTIACFNRFLDYVEVSTNQIAHIAKSIYPKYRIMVKDQDKFPKKEEYLLGSIETLFERLKSLGFSPTKITRMKD